MHQSYLMLYQQWIDPVAKPPMDKDQLDDSYSNENRHVLPTSLLHWKQLCEENPEIKWNKSYVIHANSDVNWLMGEEILQRLYGNNKDARDMAKACFGTICDWLADRIRYDTEEELEHMVNLNGSYIYFFLRLIKEKLDNRPWRCVRCGIPSKIENHCRFTENLIINDKLSYSIGLYGKQVCLNNRRCVAPIADDNKYYQMHHLTSHVDAFVDNKLIHIPIDMMFVVFPHNLYDTHVLSAMLEMQKLAYDASPFELLPYKKEWTRIWPQKSELQADLSFSTIRAGAAAPVATNSTKLLKCSRKEVSDTGCRAKYVSNIDLLTHKGKLL